MADALGTPPAAATPTVGVVSDEDYRLDQGAFLATTTGILDIRTGVMHGPGTTALVTGTSATGTMTVAIGAHHWVTSRSTADGVYVGTLEAPTTVTIAAAPGSNSRIDVVYVKQGDSSTTVTTGLPTDATSAPVYGVEQGLAAVSPVKKAIPVGAVELATVTVATGATSTNGANVTITNTVRQTVTRGAPIPVRTSTERDALTTFPLLAVKRLDTGNIEVRNAANTAWQTVAFTGVPLPRAQITSTRTGIVSAVQSGLGATSAFTTTENVAGLTTEVTDGVQLNQTGIYNIHAASKLTVGSTGGASSLSIVGAADTTVYARQPMGSAGETDGNVTVAPLVVTAVPFTVRFLSYVTTAGGTAYTRQTTVDIVRVGDA